MAEEIYLRTLEAERDEDISEAELIRTIYLPVSEIENQQDTTPAHDAGQQMETPKITKERILELVEEGKWSVERGREEYGRLEEQDTADNGTDPATQHPVQTYTGDSKDNPVHTTQNMHRKS